ncbi:MAG: hypothetical protein C4584_00335 [Armatimonadetes bacterium]|nr:MAG: hypothetical protein C4584_00335 [Armatimonadota bacterium]
MDSNFKIKNVKLRKIYMLRTLLIIIVVLLVFFGGYFIWNNQMFQARKEVVKEPFISGQPSSLPTPTHPQTSTPTPTSEINSLLSCSSDSECVSVRADNCDCTAGGTATAINRNFVDQWEKDHPRAICPAVMSGDWTCINSTPKCLSNECKLVKRN